MLLIGMAGVCLLCLYCLSTLCFGDSWVVFGVWFALFTFVFMLFAFCCLGLNSWLLWLVWGCVGLLFICLLFYGLWVAVVWV